MNGLWGLGALFFEVEGFFFFRSRGLRLTCRFCAQIMKVKFILRCIWEKCVCLVHVLIFKADVKKHDFSLHLFSCYMVCNFANENKELPMLFRGLESFNWVNVTVSKLMISTAHVWERKVKLLYSCLMSVMQTSWQTGACHSPFEQLAPVRKESRVS